MKKLIRAMVFAVTFLTSFYTYSQYTTQGTFFWLSYHENFASNANAYLYITSGEGATGTVSIPGTGWTEDFNIGVNGSVQITLPAATAIITNNNNVLNQAVKVESDSPIAVYAANQRQASSDATLVLPVHALGDSYIVNAYTPLSSSYPTHILLVGVQDNTVIEVIPTANVMGGVNAGTSFNVTLNEGEVYFIKSTGDLSGSIVRAFDPDNCYDFAVFSGNKCANVPTCGYCDHLFEQMIPVKAWGQKYITTPLMTRNGDQFRIIASEDFTTVNINGGADIFLNTGQFHEVYLQPASDIVADKPIAVAQYSRGTQCDGVTSDPFMIMLSPTEQLIDYIVFQAFNTPVINNFYTNVVTKTAHTGDVLLDGNPMTNWQTVPSNPEFSYARTNTAQGTHVLESPHGLLAIVYGFGSADSYGYTAGANIQPLNVSFDLILDEDIFVYDEFSDSLNCNFLTVDFQTTTPDIYNVAWSFGGGEYEEGTFVTHTFPAAGEYMVTMYYMREGSCVLDSIYMSLVVDGEFPEASNSGPHCIGETAQLYGSDAVSHSWTGPAGFSSTEQNPEIPNFQAENEGVYTLETVDNDGCVGLVTTELYLHEYQELFADNTGDYCEGESINLSIEPDGMVDYNWTGPNSFASSDQNPVISNSTSQMSGNYTVVVTNNNGCTISAQTQVNVFDDVDATITPMPDMCITDQIIILSAQSPGGTWSGDGVNQTSFNPSNAGVGTHTIDYEVSNGPCHDSHQSSITVFDNIFIQNFSDHECDDTYTEYILTFDVIDSNGNPADFNVDNGITVTQHMGNYTETIPSAEPYSITVTDLYNACDEFILNGVRDCGCFTFSGTMQSMQPVNLCDGDCTDMVMHNNNQSLDGNDAFQFILHDGSYPLNIIRRNSTPEFCYHLIPELLPGQVYYISAIAGDDLGNGDVDTNDPCFSVSQGTPVVWYENPIAYINSSTFNTCGLEAELSAEPAPEGHFGSWTSDTDFWPINGTSIYDSEIFVLSGESGSVEFTWTVSNGVCSGSDNVTVNFLPTPTAYAGENFSVCGNEADLNAVFSLEGTTGQWSGPGTFSNPNSPNSSVSPHTGGAGQFTFLWRESMQECYTESYVTVNFIQEPAPSITPAVDTVCGITHQLSVSNVQGEGFWTAYNTGGTVITPAPNYIQGNDNPNSQVVIQNYQGHYTEAEFVWTETFQTAGLQCSNTASQSVVFAREPFASVGANDEAEICGNCYTFSADMTGSEWAEGRWVVQNVTHQFDDANLTNATVCIDSVTSFGNGGKIRLPFMWIVDNHGCSSIDTMNVTFYKRPVANAGLDGAICGNYYDLGAVYNIPNTPYYDPSGVWAVHSRPVPTASATITPLHSDSVQVTVSNYGEWEFLWRENNSFLTSCYATDTVKIEFVEEPIVDAGPDKHVCGKCTDMEAISAGFSGSWLPVGQSFPNDDFDNPTANICVNSYGPTNFVWQESNLANTSSLSCTSSDSVKITFWRIPSATILTDEADSTTCGLTFNNLRAQQPGTGITGYWWNNTDPDANYINPNSHNTSVSVTTYGYHDFYWIAANGPTFQPDFCLDTAGPLTIHFIEIPKADAGGDTLFCGYSGSMNASPSVGTGIWSTPSTQLITFEDNNNPNTEINSQVLTGSSNPYFNVIWTEDNTNGCTDRDTIKVRFARIPSSEINIVPPKCQGEPATLAAVEDSLAQYSWNFYSGIIDSIAPENNAGGLYEHFVYWTNQDTAHQVSLVATNSWGCQSLISIDTVNEPPIPDFDVIIINDTCLLGKGGIIFQDTLGTNAFYWVDSAYGPLPGTPITAVFELPEGDYPVRARYRTVNQQWYNYYIQTFGDANCTDTIYYSIEPIGIMEAFFEIPPTVMIDNLVAPEAEVVFNNLSDYGGVRRRCIWNFGDGNTLTSCDEQVEHIYTEPGCYEPFLIIMNRDLQDCRDTAFVDACITVDNESSLEVPNIFTPNGDGINDYFQVKAETIKSFNGYIVNRWGTVVYEWSNWMDEEAGWDGNLPGGTKATSGVYYYIINAVGMDDVVYEKQGALHLLR